MTSPDAADAPPRPADYRSWAGLASGFLLWLTFPPAEWHWFAWIALVPLFWLTIQPGSPWKIYLSAWGGGLVFWLPAVQWIRLTDPSAIGGWLAMAVIFSVWWPGFVLITRLAVFRLKLPLILAAPLIWVGLEHARVYVLSGFPWYYLAHSQFRNLYLIQIADLTGSLGLSLLIAVVNAWAVDLISLPLLKTTATGTRITRRQMLRLWSVAILVCSTLTYGAYRISTAQFREGPKLALLQSNIKQELKSGGDWEKIILEFRSLIERALRLPQRPDLIVWPETSYPYGFVSMAPAMSTDALSSQVTAFTKMTAQEWIEYGKFYNEQLHAWTDAVQVPMLVGSLYYDHRPEGLRKYNTALLFSPQNRTVQTYHKMQLVPFGEYVPFLDTLPWIKVFTPYSTGYVPNLTFGPEPTQLTLNGYRLAVAICFEDTVPGLVRQFFRSPQIDEQPDVLLNISNDGWFHASSELDMHLAVSAFRCVENRVPLARAVNTGMTALIDGNGQIRETLPKQTSDVLAVTVPLDDRTSFYSSRGDWLGTSCLATTVGLFLMGLVGRSGRRTALSGVLPNSLN